MSKLHFKFRRLVFLFFLLINGTVIAQIDTLSILHITDLHVIFNQDGYPPDMMEYRKQKQYDQGEYRLRQFLETVPGKTKSDMVIATGDLVDFFEAETTGCTMLDLQAEQFSRLTGDYNIPMLLTLGNHDLFTFQWRDSLLLHHQNSSVRARAAWIRNLPCFRDGTSYSRVFQTGRTTYRLIFLDNAFYQFRTDDKTEVPYIDKSQLYWLDAQLHISDDDIEIILMHIPLDAVDTRPESPNSLYSVLAGNPSTRLILSGHYHKNVIDSFPSENNNKIIQVLTGSLVQNTENWRQIRLTEKNILVSIPGKTESEMKIPVK